MNETNPLVFYANRNCPYAQRSWMTLLELSVNFEYKEIELGKDNKTDWFCALNPNSTVPVITHGETVVYESLVVNEYLCEVFGGNGLTMMPSQPAARARAIPSLSSSPTATFLTNVQRTRLKMTSYVHS